jgi:hypothetical protein
LGPEFGGVVIYIRRPDGTIVQYAPVLCKLAGPEMVVLRPQPEAVEGEDRHSENVFLSYGTYGHYFDRPGEYQLRALYQGPGDLVIASRVHRLRIGQPYSQEEERLAQDFYTDDVGLALYLRGSSSPYLEKGMSTLQEVAERYQTDPLGAQVAMVLAESLSRPFFRIEEGKVVKMRDAQPDEALERTAQAIAQQKRDGSSLTNLTYHQLGRLRADLLSKTGESEQARKELRSLTRDLKKRGVNQSVLDELELFAKNV